MKNYKIKSYKSNVFFVFILITLIFIQCKDDDDNGNIYGKISEDEPTDDAIGVFKDGVPSFF